MNPHTEIMQDAVMRPRYIGMEDGCELYDDNQSWLLTWCSIYLQFSSEGSISITPGKYRNQAKKSRINMQSQDSS